MSAIPAKILDGSDLQNVRYVLGDMGKMQNLLVVDEDGYVSNDTDLSGSGTVYTNFQNIEAVNGVWHYTDINFTGTNYASSGTYDPFNGKIYLTTNPGVMTRIIASYVRQNGITDNAVNRLYTMAKLMVASDVGGGFDYFAFNLSSDVETLATYTAYAVAAYYAILELNSANAVQAGYSYRIRDFDLQSKLWGEGMSAEVLLNQYWMRATYMMDILKRNAGKWAYIIDLSNQTSPHFKGGILRAKAATMLMNPGGFRVMTVRDNLYVQFEQDPVGFPSNR